MEGSGAGDKPSMALAPVNPVPERSGTAQPEELSRQRNMLVLCTLYYLYGDEEKIDPDWKAVADKILEQKIPLYGEEFTGAVCEEIYYSMLENGLKIGITGASAILKVPKRLKENDKRVWMIAQISTDIWRTGKLTEQRVKQCIKVWQEAFEAMGTNRPDRSENIYRQLRQAPTFDPEDDPDYADLFAWQNLDAQQAAVELWQLELLQNIVGTHDVLKLAKYCQEAAEFAVKRVPAVEKLRKAQTACKPSDSMIAPDVSPQKPQDKTAELAKPAGESPQKAAKPGVPPTCIELSSDDESVKAISPTKPISQSKAPVEILTASTATRQPEYGVKQMDVSQQKTPTKPSTRSNSRDSTPAADSAKEALEFSKALALLPPLNANGKVGDQTSPAKSHASTITLGSSIDSPVRDPNGAVGTRDAVTDKLVNEAVSSKPCLVEVVSSPAKPLTEKSVVIVDPENKSDEAKDDSKKTESELDESVVLESSFENVVTLTDEPAESSSKAEEQPQAVKIKEQTKVMKGKPGLRKSFGAARKVFKRTSSRLASPEPKEPSQNDEDKPVKRTRGRHASSSDAKPPVLRSRRVATPTTTTQAAVAAVEKEVNKTPSVDSKPDAVVAENNDEETFETPRTSPESPEMKNESDGNQEGKPKLKTYSAATFKPSSPLSHVDPKIFDEYDNDEDDPELAMIDNNVNKTKGDKGSAVTKGYSKRGRTVSSEQASENNEETSPSKRATRKGGPTDDIEESTEPAGQTDDENAKSKRLTRSSLKMHDAANDEGGEPSSRTESEKAGSESSFGGKEKKARKSMIRGRKLFDEKQRVSGELETEEAAEKKRVTRARAKTGTSFSEKRSKPSAESEGVSENEPTPTRATRSRASTSTSVAVNEPVPAPQPVLSDDEDAKFRKTALSLLEKVSGQEVTIAVLKFEDPEKVVKSAVTFQDIKQRIETGKLKSLSSIQKDLTNIGFNALFANPNSLQAKEAVLEYYKLLKDGLDVSNNEPKSQRNSSSQRMDNSDVESLESHEDSRSESAPKSVINSGGRRKRRRSASETSEDVFSKENKRRVTRTSVSSSFQQAAIRKPKHPISPDIVSVNRVRH